MAGIKSIGVYIPVYRLALEEIGRMWRVRGPVGEKAVAGYDEDTVTMAVAAARECKAGLPGQIDALYFATTMRHTGRSSTRHWRPACSILTGGPIQRT